MTAQELLKLMSPNTLVSLVVDLLDADGERTWDEARLAAEARFAACDMIGEDRYRKLMAAEHDRRSNHVRSVL